MDLDTLSPSQRQALSQLQAVTNGGDTEVAIGVLDSVGWDVQVSFLLMIRTLFALERLRQLRSAVRLSLAPRLVISRRFTDQIRVYSLYSKLIR